VIRLLPINVFRIECEPTGCGDYETFGALVSMHEASMQLHVRFEYLQSPADDAEAVELALPHLPLHV